MTLKRGYSNAMKSLESLRQTKQKRLENPKYKVYIPLFQTGDMVLINENQVNKILSGLDPITL